MNLSDNLFIEDAEHDIGYFRRNDQTKRVLVFPPVNNYRRFLVHQLVQEQFQDLQTFSVGQGLSRRLVVCFKCDFVGIPKVNENTSTTGDCFNWKSLNKMGKKNQSTPNSSPEHNSRRSRPAPVALYRPPAARRSQTESSPPESRSTDTNSASTSRDKNRQKRPDRAVYVPKHRRSVTENEDLPVASESTSAGHNATTKRKAGKKASVRSRDSSDEKTNDRVQSDNSVIVNNLIQKPLTNKSTKESESDERENEGKVTDSITSDAFEHISLSKNYTDDCIKEVRTVEIPEQNVIEPELSVDNYNAEVKVMKDTEIIVIESDESSNSNSAEVKDIKDTEIIVIESDQSSNSNSAEVKDIKDTEIIVIESEESVDSCTAAEVKDIKDLGQNSILEQITISCAADVNILEGCERIVKLGETLHSSKTDVEMSEISKPSAIASEKKEKSVCFDECSKNMPNKTAVLKISKSEKVEKKKEKNVVSVEKQNLTETLRISEPKKVEKQTEKVSKKQPISPTSESKPPEKKKKIESDETKSTNEQKTLNRDECDWDTLFDDDGECLDPSLMDEITASVGEVTIEQAKSTSKSTKKAPVEISNDEFGHVIEIYNFPAELKSQDLAAIFSSFKSRGFELKWVDDTHCLGVFGSAKIAAEVLASEHPFVKTRPLSEATALSKAKARRTSEFLQPYRDRPQTCAALARRLVTKSLGVTLATARQEREQEKIVLREAKEKKRLANKQREEIWEGVIPQKS